MTGIDVIKRSLLLLGYVSTDTITANSDRLLRIGLDIINQLCFDLKMPTIDRLEDELLGDETRYDALCYGTAMLVALTEGDGAKNEIFTKIYNAKRALVLSSIEKVEDKLPSISYGDD
jgi:hypothetical protein